jgi:inorganic pyrophosphatase
MIKVLIQSTSGSSERRVYDEQTLEYKGTRKLHPPTPYPYPYGFIVGTHSDDGGCVDCYVITHEPLEAGAIVACEPLGLLEQHEGDEIDHKILAVLPGQNIELNQDVVKELRSFITAIFANAPDMHIKVGDLLPREKALEHIQERLESK